ncbi:MAG: cobalamin-dependent protein, partial [Desulfobulbaceae bacterium]|nr:cobalamin-dependent protein [Desulfobulbaceae bacterium]
EFWPGLIKIGINRLPKKNIGQTNFMRILLIDFNPFMPAVTPISLGNLGAELKASGHDVKVLSLGSASRFSLKGLLSFLKDFKPRLVGFGTYQRNIFQVRAVAGMVKEAFPDCSVVLGGPQTTFLPDEAILIMPEIDYVSRGEGELTIKAIVEAIEGGGGD